MSPDSDRRTNIHQQGLVDVAVLLRRAYDDEYSRRFMEGMQISEQVIVRVLADGRLRSPLHRGTSSPKCAT